MFQDDWRLISKICLGICTVALFIVVLLPESPRWLARKHKFKAAEKAYRKLNGNGSNGKLSSFEVKTSSANHLFPFALADVESSVIDKEVQAMIEQCRKPPREHGVSKGSLWAKLKRPNIYKPLVFLTGFFTLQQFTGVFVIIVYIGKLADSVGITVDVFVFTVVTGAVRFVAVIVSAFGCDKFGRRKLGIASGLGIAMSCLAVAASLWYPFGGKSQWYAAFFLLLYVFISTMGFLTLPFAMMSEIYPPDIRGFATGINVCFAYTLAFVVIKSFPFVMEAVGPANILTFISVLSLIGVGYLYKFMPETKGKTMKELEEMYARK